MIDSIRNWLIYRNPRTLSLYQRFLKAQGIYIKEKYSRFFSQLGYESSAIALLKYILNFGETDFLERQPNNVARYLYHVRYIYNDIINIFRRAVDGKAYKNLFFYTEKQKTLEYLLPVDDVNALTTLPMMSDSWQEWRKVVPLRLWTQNSYEFTTKLLHSRIEFSISPPNYAILLLDPVALILKYYVWSHDPTEQQKMIDIDMHNIQLYFLHKYVICPLIWDLADTWLLNQLNEVLDITDSEELRDFTVNNLQLEQNYGKISSGSKAAFEQIYDTLDDIKENLHPEKVLSSSILYRQRSIVERILYGEDVLPQPYFRAYRYAKYLKNKNLLWFILKLYSRRPTVPECKRIKQRLIRQVGYYLDGRVWETCQDLDTKQLIETDLLQMREFLLSIYTEKK